MPVTSWRCYIRLPTDNDLISSMPMEEQEAKDKDRQSKEEGLDHIAARTSAKDVRNTESDRREKRDVQRQLIVATRRTTTVHWLANVQPDIKRKKTRRTVLLQIFSYSAVVSFSPDCISPSVLARAIEEKNRLRNSSTHSRQVFLCSLFSFATTPSVPCVEQGCSSGQFLLIIILKTVVRSLRW